MVASVAFSAIKSNYKKFAGSDCDLDENYRILRGVKAFGGKPNMLSLKKTKADKDTKTTAKEDNDTKKENEKQKGGRE